MPTWVNFKELREKLEFERVLRHYGVEVKRKGDQHHGFCPLPAHNGNRNSPSFSASLTKGIFQCFGCGAKGNILDFAALMERIPLKDGVAFRQVALQLQERFCAVAQSPATPKTEAPPANGKAAPADPQAPRIVNASLDFELKGLDPAHPYLKGRGFTDATIAHFGLGFCSRGLLKDLLAIPLHDQKGRLIGYAGRVVDDKAINETNPRYRFPSKREREGKIFEFRKTHFVYNGFRIQEAVQSLIVVEGFTSVWWLHQAGLPNTVAIMGWDCSERQANIIVSLVNPSGHIWLMPDGDEAGKRGAESLLRLLSPHRFVRWVKLGEDQQPTDLSPEQLKSCFTI